MHCLCFRRPGLAHPVVCLITQRILTAYEHDSVYSNDNSLFLLLICAGWLSFIHSSCKVPFGLHPCFAPLAEALDFDMGHSH